MSSRLDDLLYSSRLEPTLDLVLNLLSEISEQACLECTLKERALESGASGCLDGVLVALDEDRDRALRLLGCPPSDLALDELPDLPRGVGAVPLAYLVILLPRGLEPQRGVNLHFLGLDPRHFPARLYCIV